MAQSRKQLTAKPKIAITMDGGLVQNIVTDTPDLLGRFQICIIDYDTMDSDWDELTPVDQGNEENAYAHVGWADLHMAAIKIPEPCLSIRDYVARSGAVCPYCRSQDIEGSAMDPAGDTITQEVVCNDCGRSWQDVFRLAGYEPVKQ